jgi:hypothetical protein
MSSFFVIKSQNLGLDYFNEAFSTAGVFSYFDRHVIYPNNYVIVALVE